MITDPEERIILLIGRMHYVTAAQVHRRFYATRSDRRAQQILKGLADNKYLDRLQLRAARRGGSSPIIYTLGPNGRKHVASLGRTIPKRYRPSEKTDPSPLHMDHALLITDCLITLELLEGHARLEDFIHDRELKGMRLPYTPDAFLDIRTRESDGEYQDCYLLEADRRTEDRVFFQNKIQRLSTFITSPAYRSAFHTDAFSGVLIVTIDDTRAQQLIDWIKPVIDNKPHLEGVFRVVDDYGKLPTIL